MHHRTLDAFFTPLRRPRSDWRSGFVVTITCVALGACGTSPTTPQSTTGDATSDGISTDSTLVDGAAGDGAATPPIANISATTGPTVGLFDCTSLGIPPTRLTATPMSCVLSPTCTTRLVVGHRGAGGEFARVAPENSLAAIRAALWMGQDGIEVDVRHTSDDRLVLMHDGSVDRTTNGKGSVSTMTLQQVTALSLNGHNQSQIVYAGDFSCEHVPSFAEVLALIKGRIFIDLDTKTNRIDLVVAAIVAADVIDQVFVSVSDPAMAAKARAINPTIRVQIRPHSAAELADALKLFPKRPPEVIEVPTAKAASLRSAIHDVGAKVFVNGFPVDAQQLVLGDQSQKYLKLYTDGTDIVQTEFPGAVLQALGRVNPPKHD